MSFGTLASKENGDQPWKTLDTAKTEEQTLTWEVEEEGQYYFYVQDEAGKILSQSWIWRNKNVLCFDNIEAVEKDSENRKVISKEILETVQRAAKDFVETDKMFFEEYENKKIAELEEKKREGKISLDLAKSQIEENKAYEYLDLHGDEIVSYFPDPKEILNDVNKDEIKIYQNITLKDVLSFINFISNSTFLIISPGSNPAFSAGELAIGLTIEMASFFTSCII